MYIVSVNCFERNDAHFLCEVPPAVNDHVTTTASTATVSKNIHFPAKPNFTRSDFPFNVTSCPDGHVTHEMFACDAASACWVDAVATSRSCRSSLQPLPPSFTCTTGQDDVPYTLVCDHRPDCMDSSDESFCDFTPCDPVTQFDCGNREVRSPFVSSWVSVTLSVSLSTHLSFWVSVSLFVRLSAYLLSACLSSFQSACITACLSASLLACFCV